MPIPQRIRAKGENSAPPPPRQSQGAPAERPVVRRMFVESILREMKQLDPRCRRLLQRHNLWSRGPVGLYENVALEDYIAFFEAAAVLLNRPTLGIELDQKFRLWEVGPVYHLLTSAPTLREAFAVFMRFQRIWQSHTTMEAEPGEAGTTCYVYRIEDGRIWPRRQDAKNVLSALCVMVRHLTTERWKPVAVGFEHSVGDTKAELQTHFRCKIKGLSERSSLLLRDEDLDRPLQTGRSRMPWKEAQDLMGVIENHLFELLSPADPAPIALEHRLGRLIAARLGRDSLALEDLAASLGLTPRTLRRHLSQQGLHFGAVLEQERRRRAAQLLEGGQIRIEELARLLGYASPAAFSRAYRKWTGITPSMALQQARGHQQMPHPRDHADEA